MSHLDHALDPSLQSHIQPHNPQPRRPPVQQQRSHSFADLQASQILSHFQYAPNQAGDGHLQQQQQPALHQQQLQGGQSFEDFAGFEGEVGDVIPSEGYDPESHLQHQQHHELQTAHQQQPQLAQQGSSDQHLQHLPAQPSVFASPSSLTQRVSHPSPSSQHQPLQEPTSFSAEPSGLKRPYDPPAPRPYEEAEEYQEDTDVDEVDDVDYLRREVKRLRRELRTAQEQAVSQTVSSRTATSKSKGDAKGTKSASGAAKRGRKSKSAAAEVDEEEKKKVNALTGKRETASRQDALFKAIRGRMRELLGIADDDPRLPGPHDPQPLTEPGGEVLVYQRPDWKAGLKDESNRAWIESIAQQVVQDGWKVSRAASTSADFDSKTRIPDEDLEFDVAFKAAKTSFNNFAKKWASQNDPVAIEKAIVNAKKGRRWARKDLKQKKRSKAALDPSYTSLYSEDPASHILKLDYMSSEYSSEGDDAGLVGGRLEPGLWETLSGRDPDPTLNKGKGEKVLEIRTPMWRSQKLMNILSNLDDIAGAQAKAVKGNFYTAPAHKRFKLEPLRDLAIPSLDAPLQEWEFDETWLSQKTEQVEQVRQKLASASSGPQSFPTQDQSQQEIHHQQSEMDAYGGMLDIMGGGMEGYGQQEDMERAHE